MTSFLDSIRAMADSLMQDATEGQALYEANLAILIAKEFEVVEQQAAWSSLTDRQQSFWIHTAINMRAK